MYDNRCIRIWKLGAGRSPQHQGPTTDSPPPLSMAPAVMAVARRADTPARVWRRLPYTNEDIYLCLPRLFFVFRRVSFFFCVCFSNDFFGTFAQEVAKGPSLINAFSSAFHCIRARIALLSPPSPSQGERARFFHIQFKHFPPIEQKTNISTKQ